MLRKEAVGLRGFRDRDYVKTLEGLYFTVLGNVHPKDKVIAYLKYAPSNKGMWGKAPHLYDRPIKDYTVHNVNKMMSFLSNHYPQYIDEVFNIKFSAVPCKNIAVHYKPEEKLQELINLKVKDELQRKTVKLASILSKESGVSIENFGVTGSILINLHNLKFSDIDLTVYGKENSLAIKESLKNIFLKNKGEIKKFSIKDFKEWYKGKGSLYPLTFKEALTIFERAWNKGKFHETPFSIHPVKIENEVKEEFGEEKYFSLGLVTVKTKIIDANESFFMPGKYKVDFKLKHNNEEIKVEEIVTFEGFYAGIAEAGEEVLIKGKLERVENKNRNKIYFRIVIGSFEAKGKDYIKIFKD